MTSRLTWTSHFKLAWWRIPLGIVAAQIIIILTCLNAKVYGRDIDQMIGISQPLLPPPMVMPPPVVGQWIFLLVMLSCCVVVAFALDRTRYMAFAFSLALLAMVKWQAIPQL